jgi:hypothetical protein
MGYQPVVSPQQDESSDFIKKLYVCECPGCGAFTDRKAQYCIDHATAAQRVETIKEHAEHEKFLAKG